MAITTFLVGSEQESCPIAQYSRQRTFTHKTTAKGEALLDRILENTPQLEPICVEPKPILEEVSSAKAETIRPLERPSLEPKAQDEGFQPSDLPYFEDDLFEDFGNILNYEC
jgi:hypothetical protein